MRAVVSLRTLSPPTVPPGLYINIAPLQKWCFKVLRVKNICSLIRYFVLITQPCCRCWIAHRAVSCSATVNVRISVHIKCFLSKHAVMIFNETNTARKRQTCYPRTISNRISDLLKIYKPRWRPNFNVCLRTLMPIWMCKVSHTLIVCRLRECLLSLRYQLSLWGRCCVLLRVPRFVMV